MMNLIEALNKLRTKYGYTDEMIAEKIGMNKSSVFRLRKGINKHTNPNTARKIADLLDCDFTEKNNKTIFIDKTKPPESLLSPQNQLVLENVVRKHAAELGYEPTPEGLDQFLRDCRGQYKKLYTIRELFADQENNAKSEING